MYATPDLVDGRVERGLVDVDRAAVGVAQLDLVARRERAARLARDPEVLAQRLAQRGVRERLADPVDDLADAIHQPDQRVGGLIGYGGSACSVGGIAAAGVLTAAMWMVCGPNAAFGSAIGPAGSGVTTSARVAVTGE